MANCDFDFLILCGGRGQRMAGLDKPLLDYRGQPMVASIARTVPQQTPTLISANRNLTTYRTWGTVFTDSEVALPDAAPGSPTMSGPLVGVLGGLDRCSQAWLLVSPGDTPCLSDVWYKTLIAHRNEVGAVIVDSNRQQNLHLLLARQTRSSLLAFLAAGKYRVWEWLAEIGVASALTDHPEWFTNINSQADLTD